MRARRPLIRGAMPQVVSLDKSAPNVAAVEIDAPQISGDQRHPKFDWTGFDRNLASVNLSLHAQYVANETIHRLIVEEIKRVVTSTPDVALFCKNWQDESVRATTAQFVKRMLRRNVRAADKLDEQGDLSLWIEIEPADTMSAPQE